MLVITLPCFYIKVVKAEFFFVTHIWIEEKKSNENDMLKL